MRNLQYEMRICQKSHNKVTKTVHVWFEFLWIRRYVNMKKNAQKIRENIEADEKKCFYVIYE
jgi:hypothetical protein